MKFASALLAHFGLNAKDETGPDAFDLRLTRIEQREAKRDVQQVLFRNQPTPQAA